MQYITYYIQNRYTMHQTSAMSLNWSTIFFRNLSQVTECVKGEEIYTVVESGWGMSQALLYPVRDMVGQRAPDTQHQNCNEREVSQLSEYQGYTRG